MYVLNGFLFYPTVEAPTSVKASSSRNGGSLDLICSITLAQAVSTDVTVEAIWTGPNGSPLSGRTTPTGTNTSYSSTLSLSSVTVSDAGIYNCTATLTSTSLYLISSTSVVGYTEVIVQRKLFFFAKGFLIGERAKRARCYLLMSMESQDIYLYMYVCF